MTSPRGSSGIRQRAGTTGRGGLRPWMFGIATDLVARHRRKEARHYAALARRAPEPVGYSEENRIVDAVAAGYMRPLLAKALATDQGERDVVLLLALASSARGDLSGAGHLKRHGRLSAQRRPQEAAPSDRSGGSQWTMACGRSASSGQARPVKPNGRAWPSPASASDSPPREPSPRNDRAVAHTPTGRGGGPDRRGNGCGHRGLVHGGPHNTAPVRLSARQVLLAAATVAATQPSSGAYWHVKEVYENDQPAFGHPRGTWKWTRYTQETWTNRDGAFWVPDSAAGTGRLGGTAAR